MQSGKKARTKFSVPGPIESCFDVLVSFHEPIRERPTLVLACAELNKTGVGPVLRDWVGDFGWFLGGI